MNSRVFLIAAVVTGIFFGLVLIAGIVLSIVFLVPYPCSDFTELAKNHQLTCKTKQSDFVQATIDIVNVSDPRGVTTYAFSSEPERTTLTETYTHTISGTSSQMDLVLQNGAKYTFVVSCDKPISFEYCTTQSKKSRYFKVMYSQKDVSSSTSEYTSDKDHTGGCILISSPENNRGTLTVIVDWPVYEIHPEDVIDKCDDYPCSWNIKEKLADKDEVWFVTQNTGDPVAVRAQKRYEFVPAHHHWHLCFVFSPLCVVLCCCGTAALFGSRSAW